MSYGKVVTMLGGTGTRPSGDVTTSRAPGRASGLEFIRALRGGDYVVGGEAPG